MSLQEKCETSSHMLLSQGYIRTHSIHSKSWVFSNDNSGFCGVHPHFIWFGKCLPIWVKYDKNYKEKWELYIKSNAIE
ncbi:unnamed protein product [Gordionus sp. m RMFG-2023]